MENIDISFAPDTSSDSEKRISDIENYLALLSERIRFCFENIGEEYSAKQDESKDTELILSALSDGVGEFTNSDKNCEIFNDYSENIAQSYFSHAEGSKTSATAPYAHAEGYATTASAPSAHAEGDESKAANNYAHAEGKNTQATGYASHAEGEDTAASGWLSHAEGKNTVADGMYTHAGGMDSHSLGIATFAHGKGANAYGDSSAVFGKYNATVNYPFVVGIGYADNNRIDGMALDWDGNLRIAGRLTADGGVEIDLSEYLRSDEIADWAKADSKPKYTAAEVGAAAESHSHTVSEITDMPDWAKSAVKPEYTAAEVGAATLPDITAAVDGLVIGGQNLLRNTYDCSGWVYNSAATVKQTDSEGYTVMTFIASHDTGRSIRPQPNIPYSMIRNKKITVSFEVKSDGEYESSNDGYMFLRLADSTGSYITRTPSLYTVTNTGANWEKAGFCVYISDSLFSIPTSQTEPDFDSALTAALDFVHPAGIPHSLSLRKFKLELGDKATDWSIANADIAEHFARLSALETAILSGGEG